MLQLCHQEHIKFRNRSGDMATQKSSNFPKKEKKSNFWNFFRDRQKKNAHQFDQTDEWVRLRGPSTK